MATVIQWEQGKGSYWTCLDCSMVSGRFKDTADGDRELYENRKKHDRECRA